MKPNFAAPPLNIHHITHNRNKSNKLYLCKKKRRLFLK